MAITKIPALQLQNAHAFALSLCFIIVRLITHLIPQLQALSCLNKCSGRIPFLTIQIWNYTFLLCKFLCFLCILHFRLFTLFLFPSFPPVANLDSANGDNYCHYKEQHSAWKIFHSFFHVSSIVRAARCRGCRAIPIVQFF